MCTKVSLLSDSQRDIIEKWSDLDPLLERKTGAGRVGVNNNEKREFNHSVKAVKSLTTLSNKLLYKKNKN